MPGQGAVFSAVYAERRLGLFRLYWAVGGFWEGLAGRTTARCSVQFAKPGIPATAGARVNPQCDILAKHVEKLLRRLDVRSPLTVEKLRENG